MQQGRLVTLAGLAVILGACHDPPKTEDLTTHALGAEYAAVARGDGTTTVTAALWVANSSHYAQLSAGDSLRASSGSDARPMSMVSSDAPKYPAYAATFSGDSSGKQFTVALQRNAQQSAPNSTVTLPPPVTFTSPASGAVVSPSGGVTIRWETSTPLRPVTVMIQIAGRTDTYDFTVDPGSYALSSYDIGRAVTGDGRVIAEVSRIGTGVTDPAFGQKSSFIAAQARTLVFTIR